MIKDFVRVAGALMLFTICTATAMTCAELPRITAAESNGFEPTPLFTVFVIASVIAIVIVVVFGRKGE